MIRKLLRYLVVTLIIFFVMSCISHYEHLPEIEASFSLHLAANAGITFYILTVVSGIIFGVKVASN